MESVRNMPFSAGDHLGAYEILAPIGAACMGEGLARDAKLKRDVAPNMLNQSNRL